jgi:phosphoribosyl-ATP pyrophosphohydrolase
MKENVEIYKGSTALYSLYNVIKDRRQFAQEGSYTKYLFDSGLDKILKKCGEELAETLISAKNYQSLPNNVVYRDDLKNEVCDLLYHLLVMMVELDISLTETMEILERRATKIGNLKEFKETDRNS